jgi:hypothetical protein
MARKFKGRRYLHIRSWDDGQEVWLKQPHEMMPALTVECREDADGMWWHHTWTYNLKDGQAVKPRGHNWQHYQQVDRSTEWRRPANRKLAGAAV